LDVFCAAGFGDLRGIVWVVDGECIGSVGPDIAENGFDEMRVDAAEVVACSFDKETCEEGFP
jgi:hypothetical protein